MLCLLWIIGLFQLTQGLGQRQQEENSLYKVCRPVLLSLDVLFLLDGSGSVSGNTFEMQMNMLRKVVELMRPAQNKSRLAVMQYAGYTRLEVPFAENRTEEEIIHSLQKVKYMSGSTKTGKALKKARDLFKQERKRKEAGSVHQVAIVVSDGHSHDDPMKAAAALRTDGVSVVVLGIGHHVNRNELLDITDDEELAFQDLNKAKNLVQFEETFSKISTQLRCDYFRGTNSTRFDTILTVLYSDCGVEEAYMDSPQGHLFSSTVILQFDAALATQNDARFKIRCFQGIDNFNHRFLDDSVFLPPSPCRYTVRPQGRCDGITVSDPLIHSWKCDYDDAVISVHSCEVYDPTTLHSYRLTDGNGCSKSQHLASPNHTGAAAIARGTAVRFPTSPLVVFRCRLRICRGESCKSKVDSCRQKREIEVFQFTDSPLKEQDNDYKEEYEEIAVAASARNLGTSAIPTLTHTPLIQSTGTSFGVAAVRPLAIPESTIFPGFDVVLSTKGVAVIDKPDRDDEFKEVFGRIASKDLREAFEELKTTKEITTSATKTTLTDATTVTLGGPELIVFGKSGDLERITRQTATHTATTTLQQKQLFPTLVSTDPTTTEDPASHWQVVDVFVESEPMLIRLENEQFMSSCPPRANK